MPLDLAKDVIDFGLYTNDREAMLAFWQGEVGLPFEETLPAGAGVHQLRHGLGHGSIMKINHSKDPLPDPGPSGYRELRIAREGLEAPKALVDPDGNRIALVPVGHAGIDGIGVQLAVRDEAAHARFFGEVLELPEAGERCFRCGGSLLFYEEEAAMPEDVVETNNRKMRARGFRYTTIQVRDVDVAHAEAVRRGALEGYPPLTLGKVARISFVRDPDGNWIELSQRASLVGRI